MAIPDVSRDEIIAAMELFDQELRHTEAWHSWEDKGNHHYAIQHEGRLYPVKQTIALAANVGTNTFSGGNEANRYVTGKGFDVVRLREQNSYIFQSNPAYFDLTGALAALSQINWDVNRYLDSIRSGDTVYLWEAGDNAGIVAVAHATSQPGPFGAAPGEEPFLRSLRDSRDPNQVRLTIDQVLPRRITRAELKDHPVLGGMLIMRAPNSTNFRLTDDEAEALADLFEERAGSGITGDEQRVLNAIERLVPVASDRPALLNGFADAIIAADQVSPGQWALSLANDGLRLTVGHHYLATLHDGILWITFDPDVAGAEVTSRLQRAGIQVEANVYTQLNASGVSFTAANAESLLPLVGNAQRQTMVAAAAGTLRKTSKSGHVTAAIRLLEKLLNRRLPQPRYDETATKPSNVQGWSALLGRFTDRYGTFTSDAYLRDERDYKLAASRKLRDLLSRERMSGHIERGTWDEARDDIKRSMYGNNLLNQWDMAAITEAPAEPLVRALFNLLHSNGPFEARFNAWVDVLTHAAPGVWPATTYFLMLHNPDSDIYVKPTPYQSLLRAMGRQTAWPTRPTARYYEELRELANLLLVRLQSLGAQDMIDVQSFIWFVQQPVTVPKADAETNDNGASIQVGKTGVEAGLSMQQQLLIALKEMIRLGGQATTQQLYKAVESHMNGVPLSDQGQATLRGHINREAVNRGLVTRHTPYWIITDAGRQLIEAPSLDNFDNTLGDKTVARLTSEHAQRVYVAAQRFVNAALRNDDSLFTPGQAVWTAENIADLYQRFAGQPDTGADTFMVKFERQLAGAPSATVQLAAEVLFVHFLPATRRTITGDNKRRLINQVLSWSPDPASIPDDLASALDDGLASMGTAFGTFRFYLIGFLLEFAGAWKQLAEPDVTRLLDDAWAFKQMLFALPIHAAYSQREILLHLVHPDTFEPIASRDHKQRIARAFRQYITQPTDDIDRQIVQIRQRLARQHGQFHFYQPNIQPEWDKDSAPDTQIAPEPFDALGPDLRSYIRFAISLGTASYTPEEMVDLVGRIDPPIANLTNAPDPDNLVSDLMLLRLLEPQEDGRYRRWDHLSDGTEEHLLRYAALTMLQPVAGEDNKYALPAQQLLRNGGLDTTALADVEAILGWYETAGLAVRNGDEWQISADARQPLPEATPTAQAINRFLEHLARVWANHAAGPALLGESLPILDRATLDARIAEIQRELLIDTTTILRIYRSLIAGRHVILSGPPGTGKTHLARMLPRILWRDDSKLRLSMALQPERSPLDEPDAAPIVQHGYAVEVATATEDWGTRHVIGGIVPQLQQNGSGRSLVYGVRHGVLTRTVLQNYGMDGETMPYGDIPVRQPVESDGEQYRGRWLVIDEFTRAPIDAAFGSLLTTLGGQRNPRLAVPTDAGIDRSIALPGDFRLIGTLNSFDRHFLNQISEAMKRRFTFIDVLPPRRELGTTEQAMAIYRALLGLRANRLPGITMNEGQGRASLDSVLNVRREQAADDQPVRVRYVVEFVDAEAEHSLNSFWRLFEAIRVYRQLGTAQAEAVYATILAGHSIGMSWHDALDSALADVLADQLQVLSRDEQRVLVTLIQHHANIAAFTTTIVKDVLTPMPAPRQRAHLAQLKSAGVVSAASIDAADLNKLQPAQLNDLFRFDLPLELPADGLFVRRLDAFINEKGL